MVIAIDFDGTCVTHEYPKIGKDIGAVPILKKIVDNGHQLVLFTMRSNKELDAAVNWFNENEIPLYGINENPSQKVWNSSPKVYAKIYIDDAAIGCPLIHLPSLCNRPFVDWTVIEEILKMMGAIS